MASKAASKDVVEIVRQLTIPVVEEAGMELVDVEFLKEGGSWFLRIFIDKPEGISHEDCRYVSEKVSSLLDLRDPIAHSYTLEVSSPGIERPIKKIEDFNRFAGRRALISTFAPVNGQKKFCGLLMGTREDQVLMDIDGEELFIPLGQIASARLTGVL